MQFIYILTLSLFVFINTTFAIESTCYGTTKNGKLVNGVKLPSDGKNYTSYGDIPEIAGRTFVHSKVKKIVIEAYEELSHSHPNKVFKYAETGFKDGGPFKPHRTHQNGLSIDFMVPVIDPQGKSTHLPTHALNKYGYNIEFDTKGHYDKYTIDFEALGAHIVALHKASLRNNANLWRVIFDPGFQSRLYATKYGDYIKTNILIPNKRSWVRHDEHYHVDFDVNCRPL